MPDYLTDNADSQMRLQRVLQRLSDEDLGVQVSSDWTDAR